MCPVGSMIFELMISQHVLVGTERPIADLLQLRPTFFSVSCRTPVGIMDKLSGNDGALLVTLVVISWFQDYDANC
jgi:hypothetical protein